MRRALFVGVVLWAASFTFASPLPAGTEATKQAARIISMSEINAAVTGSTYDKVTKTVTGGSTLARGMSWGARVGYFGAATLGPLLIYKGLEWFYDQAQQSTGTALDSWWSDTGGNPAPGTSHFEVWGGIDFCNSSYCDWNVNYRAHTFLNGEWQTNSIGGSDSTHIVSPEWNTWEEVRQSVWDWADSQRTEAHYDTLDAEQECVAGTGTCNWVTDTFLNNGDPTRGGSYRASGAQESFAEMLATNPDAMSALQGSVIPDYVDEETSDANTFPYTYADPFGDGSFTFDGTAPNVNQWEDNPYADPSLDTDGDTYEDWKEHEAGTDANNPNQYPSADPDDGTLADADADGIPDIYDPCPYLAANTCVEASPEMPEDVATETTLRQVEGELERLNEGAFGAPGGSPAAADTAALEAYEPAFDSTAYDSLASGVGSRFQPVFDAASTKFPFGLAGWLPAAPTAANGTCEPWEIAFAGTTANLTICGSEADLFLRGTGRTIALAFLYLGFTMFVIGMAVRS